MSDISTTKFKSGETKNFSAFNCLCGKEEKFFFVLVLKFFVLRTFSREIIEENYREKKIDFMIYTYKGRVGH